MKKIYLMFFIFTIPIFNCSTKACSWYFEWKILNQADSLTLKHKVDVKVTVLNYSKVNIYLDSINDSSFLIGDIYISDATEDEFLGHSPMLNVKFILKDTTICDTTMTWQQLDFKPGKTHIYPYKTTTLSEKTLYLSEN